MINLCLNFFWFENDGKGGSRMRLFLWMRSGTGEDDEAGNCGKVEFYIVKNVIYIF